MALQKESKTVRKELVHEVIMDGDHKGIVLGFIKTAKGTESRRYTAQPNLPSFLLH